MLKKEEGFNCMGESTGKGFSMKDLRDVKPVVGPDPEPSAKPLTIKVLSLWQPWATAMQRGVKRNETRHWPTSYRGWLAIHAAKKLELSDGPDFIEFAEYWLGDLKVLPLGAIVCVVRLVDCVRTETVLEGLEEHEELFGNYDEGRWAWKTDSLLQLPNGPIFMRGHQGLFDWEIPPELAEKLGPIPKPYFQGTLLRDDQD